MNKKGQLTIFIIIAILVIALGVGFFVFKDSLLKKEIPSNIEPVYNNLVTCLEQDLETGISVLESQGGYIEIPDFESGSQHLPFSSQLNFLGNPIPYWYYVSGNNIEREQVPSKNEMEEQLADFVEFRIYTCSFENYYEQGFEIDIGEPEAKVNIKNDEVVLNLDMDFDVSREEESFSSKSQKVIVNSELGTLYEDAVDVYENEQSDLFLENYTIDILNLYAPVEGVEFSCSSKVWDIYDVFSDVQEAVKENLGVVGVKGDSKDYFVVEGLSSKISEDVYVDFLYFPDWPVTFEANPSDGPLLIAEPVGNQLGLGALGFCYVAYHFVYDLKYPVLISLHSETTGESFQFPVAVIVENNNPRKSLLGETTNLESSEICENANTEFEIVTLDSSSNRVDSEISFECVSQTCNIGNAENGVLIEFFPQCVNGFVIAEAEGFEDAEVQVSTVNSGSLTIFMDRLYEMELVLELEDSYCGGEALITFENSDGKTTSVLYPSQNTVELSAGTYDISVSVYEDVSLELDSGIQEYCTEVPRNIIGVFGFTKEECYEIEIPEQLVSQALSAGGVGSHTFSEGDLKYNSEILINSQEFPEPDSLVQIQENYILLENKNLEVIMR